MKKYKLHISIHCFSKDNKSIDWTSAHRATQCTLLLQ